MSSDSEAGKQEVENMVLDQVLDSLAVVTGRTVTDDWEGFAEQVEGSPDHIIGLNRKPFGIELTSINNVVDAWNYVAECYRLAAYKSDSYTRRGIFRFPIALAMYSNNPPLFDMRTSLSEAIHQPDFEILGFAEIWALDFSHAYFSAGDPRRPADMFCFKPSRWFGFHRIGPRDRKPYG